MPAPAQGMEEHGGWEERAGVSLLLSAAPGGPRSAESCSGLNSCSLRLTLTLQLTKGMGLSSISGGDPLPFSQLPDVRFLHAAMSSSSGDNLLQVSLQAHPFLSAPPHGEDLNA